MLSKEEARRLDRLPLHASVRDLQRKSPAQPLRMDETEQPRHGSSWTPSLPPQETLVRPDMSMGQSWSSPLRQSDYTSLPRHNLFSPAPFHPRNESGPDQPQPYNTNSPLNPITTLYQSSSRPSSRPNPSHLALPNFPLPRSSNQESNFPLSRSSDGQPSYAHANSFLDLNRTEDEPYPFYLDAASSTFQLPSIDALSSNDFTPISRPPSRFSWGSEESSGLWPNHQDQIGFVDLTTEPSPPTMPRAVRKRRSSAAPSNPAKRSKNGEPRIKDESSQAEEVDLSNVDDDNGLSKLLEQQRVMTVKAQHEQADKPLRMSTLQCIICMEPMTNITVTHCGRFSFGHTVLSRQCEKLTSCLN